MKLNVVLICSKSWCRLFYCHTCAACNSYDFREHLVGQSTYRHVQVRLASMCSSSSLLNELLLQQTIRSSLRRHTKYLAFSKIYSNPRILLSCATVSAVQCALRSLSAHSYEHFLHPEEMQRRRRSTYKSVQLVRENRRSTARTMLLSFSLRNDRREHRTNQWVGCIRRCINLWVCSCAGQRITWSDISVSQQRRWECAFIVESLRATAKSESGTKEKKDDASNTKMGSYDSADDIKKLQDDVARVNLALDRISQQLKVMSGENNKTPTNHPDQNPRITSQ